MTTDKVVKIIQTLLKSCKGKDKARYSEDYLVGYETALADLMRDINGGIQRELDGEMTELGDRNYALISQGVKTCGSFDPNEIMCMFEERLYMHEVKHIWDFLEWVHKGKQVEKFGMMMTERAFGSGNYEKRFQEFLKSSAKTVG